MSNSESQPQEFHGSVQIQPETDRATEAGQRLRRALDELGGAVLDSGQAREPGAEQDRAALWEAWEAIDRVIGEWLSTKFALARAGFALSRPDQIGIEWVGHQALDEAQHLHLSGYPYSLTPKILDVLAATQPLADTVQAPDMAELADRAAAVVLDTGQARELRRWVCDNDPSRVEHTSFVGWSPCPSCRVIEPSRDAVQAPDVAALLRRLDEIESEVDHIPGGRLPDIITTAEVRALLGTNTTREAGQ